MSGPNFYDVCNPFPCFSAVNSGFYEVVRTEYKESLLKGIEPFFEKTIDYSNKSYVIVSNFIDKDLFPLIMNYLLWIYNKSIEFSSQLHFITSNILTTQVIPFYQVNMEPTINTIIIPWYNTNIQPVVNSAKLFIIKFYNENMNEYVEAHIQPYYEKVKGKFYYSLYYLGELLEDKDRYDQWTHWIYYLIPNQISLLATSSYIHSICGIDNSLACSSIFVYFLIFIGLYLIRNLILGVVATILVVILSPILITIFIIAKIIQYFSPKGKQKKSINKNKVKEDNKKLKTEQLPPNSPIHFQYTNPMIYKRPPLIPVVPVDGYDSPKAIQELRQRKVPNIGLSGMTPAAALGLVPPNRSRPTYNQSSYNDNRVYPSNIQRPPRVDPNPVQQREYNDFDL